MMRAGLGLLVALLVLSPTAHAQGSHLGLLAGPTAATTTGSYVTASDGLELGFSFLATLDREFSRSLGVRVGVGWVQKGGKRLQITDAPGTHGYQTSYVQFPLSVFGKVRIPGTLLAVRPHAGFAVGLGMGCRYKPADRFEFEDRCDETTPGGALESLELAVPLGAALTVEFPGGSKFTILDIGYELGLTNIYADAAAAGQAAKNGVWSFRFGFLAPLY